MNRAGLSLCLMVPFFLSACAENETQRLTQTQHPSPPPLHAVQVDLDYVYDPDPEQEVHNIDRLVDYIATLQINAVFLQAFADPQGTGLARALYFPNRHLPMRQNLFPLVAEQIQSRAHVQVYGWLPVLSYNFDEGVARVLAWSPARSVAEPDAKAYKRISPFDPEGRKRILEIYEDLARQAPINGLLFHDDALLSDFEDASPPALQAYAVAGFPDSVQIIRDDPDLMGRWTSFKTESLIAFTQELTERVRQYRTPLVTVRNIYATPILNPLSEIWFAQNYNRFCAVYDYTAILAMPALENVPSARSDTWLEQLAAAVATQPDKGSHTIFELQSVDWRKDPDDATRPVSAASLTAQMRLLARQGVVNMAYYPADFIKDQPRAQDLRPDFSLFGMEARP